MCIYTTTITVKINQLTNEHDKQKLCSVHRPVLLYKLIFKIMVKPVSL